MSGTSHLRVEQEWPSASAESLRHRWLGLRQQVAAVGQRQQSILGLPVVVVLSVVTREIQPLLDGCRRRLNLTPKAPDDTEQHPL